MFNQPKSVKYFLRQEKEVAHKAIAQCLIDIKVLEKVSPDAVVGQQKLTDKSTRDILAKELLPSLRTKLASLENKVVMIIELLGDY